MGHIGFYLFAALGPLGFTVLGALWVLIFFGVLKFRKNDDISNYRESLTMKTLWLLLTVSLFSVLASPNITLSFTLVLGQFLMISFGILGGRYLIENPLVLDRFLAISSASLLVSIIVVLYRSLSVVRAETLFSRVNSTGTILVVFGGLCFTYLLAHPKRGISYLAYPLLVAVLLAVLATGSRGALLGFVGMSLILVGLNRRGIVLLLILGITLAGVVSFNDYYQQRFTRFTFSKNLDRIYIWEGTLNMIKNNPLFGIGPGLYIDKYKDYKPEADRRDRIAYAHNFFLQVGAEYGLLALGVFIFLIGLVTVCGIKLISTGVLLYRGIFGAFIGAMIHQQFDITAWNGNVGSLFWLLVGLIIASYAKEFVNKVND